MAIVVAAAGAARAKGFIAACAALLAATPTWALAQNNVRLVYEAVAQ